MKRIFCTILAAVLTLACFTSCGFDSFKKKDNSELSIVTTIFPEYDWVRQILGDNIKNAELTMLLDSGVDLHNFQPSADDIIKISSCDMFIYVGGESDKWVENTLKEKNNENMVVINLLDVLGDTVKDEELVEGMEDEEHDHDDAGGEDNEYEEEVEYDEHVWLSLRNAETLCRYIADKLSEIDADNAEAYKTNSENYIGKLKALDAEYQSAVESVKQKTILFGDRFPFRYLADDYGLKYYAAFSGCSAETEASFETISFLAGKVDELGLNSVLTIEGTDNSIAETIIQNTKTKNQSILTLDSMQSITSEDVKNGADYLAIMCDNLTVLKKALV